ncbi:MAG: gluconeogenesis factor YvcK family protein [Chloroflexota bacterium]|nr:gluconeogenesis factor YvcK family protein [Chloroflexota bacterium]
MVLHRYLRSALKWLAPGMGIKRWLLLLACGIALLSLGFSFLLRQLYPLPGIFYYLTLQLIPRGLRAGLFGLGGVVAVVVALIRLNQTLLEPFVEPDPEVVANAVYYHRQRERGPKIVAIGGGHGLSALLRGLKQYTSNITAIVTVADDGGSSGRLRRELGVLPPGDFRNCIAALADDEALTTQLFQYRFPSTSLRTDLSTKFTPSDAEGLGARGNGSGLDGHSFGNLFITAMAEVTGSFERAILESGHVLAVQGRVLPSTLHDVTLMADLRTKPVNRDGVSPSVRVTGESSITETGGTIERIYLEPDNAPAYPDAVHALLEADLIAAGPGSLYTSILPNLLVPDVAQAVAASRALKVYICNIATQRGETDGYAVSDHVTALEAHVGTGLFPTMLANDNLDVGLDTSPGVELVRVDLPPNAGYQLITKDLVDPAHPWRHDSDKLARALMQLVE